MKTFILFFLFVFAVCSLRAQYDIAKPSSGFNKHSKIYRVRLKLRYPYKNSLRYKGFLYMLDSGRLVVCNKNPRRFDTGIVFTWFSPESLDWIAYRKTGAPAAGAGIGFASSFLPLMIGATIDPGPGASNAVFSPTAVGLIITIALIPPNTLIGLAAGLNYNEVKINGDNRRYLRAMKKMSWRTDYMVY